MSEYIPLENLLKNTGGSIFKLVVLAAKRALEIAEGKKPLVEIPPETKPIETVFKEIDEHKITYEAKKKNEQT